MTAPAFQTVFTPSEVAQVLRVTSETIRRKIVAGELGAIEVGGQKRKQYRITLADLSRWLGPERSAQLFGIGTGLSALEQALQLADPDLLESEIAAAVQAVRQTRALPQSYLPTPTPAEIRQKFGRHKSGPR